MHGSALIALMGDFILNNILIEKQHVVYTMAIMILYGIELVGLKLIKGKVLYDFAALDTPASWILTFSLSFCFGFVHYLLSLVSARRLIISEERNFATI